LIVAEATQQGLVGDDFSVTNAVVVVVTLIGADILVTFLTHRSRVLDRWMNGVPLILIHDGEVIDDRLKKARIDLDDILQQARATQGLERLDQIK
ncbi:YetF domain-containing protein, partial [Staphylococcus aureus]|uniref:YetF domain-containing protein n=1 Tax=Staphylococcus aureus TaxID=1280 RepID=UPI00102396CA